MTSLLLVFGGLEFGKYPGRIIGNADVSFDKKVDESRNDIDNIKVKVCSVREKSLVCRVVSELADCSPYCQLVSGKAKAVDAFVQCPTCTAEVINKSLEANTKKRTCSPRRSIGNRHCFVKGDAHRLRHVLRWLDCAADRPRNLTVDHKRGFVAIRAPNDGEFITSVSFDKVLRRQINLLTEYLLDSKIRCVHWRTNRPHDWHELEKRNHAAVRTTERFWQ